MSRASSQSNYPDSPTSFPTLNGAGSSAKILYTLGSDPPPKPQDLNNEKDVQHPDPSSSSSFRAVIRRSPGPPSSWRKRRKAHAPAEYKPSTPLASSYHGDCFQERIKYYKSQVDLLGEDDAHKSNFVSHDVHLPTSSSSLTIDRLDFTDFQSGEPSTSLSHSHGDSVDRNLPDIVPWLYEPSPSFDDTASSYASVSPSRNRHHLRSTKSFTNLGKVREQAEKVPWLKRLYNKASSHDIRGLSASKSQTQFSNDHPSLSQSAAESKRTRVDSGKIKAQHTNPEKLSYGGISLDTDLEHMDGIVNMDYLQSRSPIIHPSHEFDTQRSSPSNASTSKPRYKSSDSISLHHTRTMDDSMPFLEPPLPVQHQNTSKINPFHQLFHSSPRSTPTSSKSASSRKGSTASELPMPRGHESTELGSIPSLRANEKDSITSYWTAPESWASNKKSLASTEITLDPEKSDEEDFHEFSRNNSLWDPAFDEVLGRLPSCDSMSMFPDSRRPSENDKFTMKSVEALPKRPSVDRQHTIRIFKHDLTHTTLMCPLNITTVEVQEMLATRKPGFAVSKGNGRLYLRERGLERELGTQERPIVIQKRRLEQAGYRYTDHLEEIERNDNSYLYKFIYREEEMPVIAQIDDSFIRSYATVDLSSRGLHTIPISLHRHADEIILLNISRNFNFDLPKDFVQSCRDLRDLRINDSVIKRVPVNVLYFPNLTFLDLAHNRISDLSHIRLDYLSKLGTLKLYGNRLTSLPPYFANFHGLKYLDISNNKFETFPEILCEMRSLVTLDISFNNLTSLPENFNKLVNLERFICVGNMISTIPCNLESLKSLRAVDLRHNNLVDISLFAFLPRLETLRCDHNSISSLNVSCEQLTTLEACHNPISSISLTDVLHTLTTLNLANAKLSTIPPEIFNSLRSLTDLTLDQNSFRVIDESLGQLTFLKRLSIKNNGLASLPDSLSNLSHLTHLDVSGNNIAALPSAIWGLRSLVSLNASSNLLRDFPSIPPAPRASLLLNTPNGSGEELNSSNSISVRSLHTHASHAPLAKSLLQLYLADNSLTDDSYHPISLLTSLNVLNLSFNDLYELPLDFLSRLPMLQQLYLSGNKLTTLPDEDFQTIKDLEVLFLNANKLQTLPTELGHLKRLKILDVGSNVLKYNIANYRFDWNWNSNPELTYLNLSGNSRLEIKPPATQNVGSRQRRNLADFDSLHKIRVLGLMDVTLINSLIPDATEKCRVRTSLSDVNGMAYGIADSLARRAEYPGVIDLVVPRFRDKSDEAILGLFDVPTSGVGSGGGGSRIAMYLQDCFAAALSEELVRLKEGEDGRDACRRAFLNVNRDYGNILFPSFDARRKDSDFAIDRTRAGSSSTSEDVKAGATGVVVYIAEKRMYVANVGDALAVISRRGGAAEACTSKHDPMSSRSVAQVRSADGFVTTTGLVNNEVDVSRSFGHYHVFPVVNACPDVRVYDLNSSDEFIILGNRGFWDYVGYQGAVDVARSERADPMIGAQKLRDLAMSYGSTSHIMVMILCLGDLFQEKIIAPRYGKGSLESATDLEAYIAQKAAKRAMSSLPVERYLTMLDREVAPPTGSLAIVFTDIRNSTFLWESNPGMHVAMRIHNQLLRRQLRAIGGYEVKTEGDSFMCSFPTVLSALLWCFTIQVELVGLDWPKAILDCEDGKTIFGPSGEILSRGLAVRMGIHWGNPVCEPDPITRRMDYFGPVVNRASRVSAVADGGQIAASTDATTLIKKLLDVTTNDDTEGGGITSALREQVKNVRQFGLEIFDIGERKLKGLETSERIFLLYPTRLAARHSYNIGDDLQQQPAIPAETYQPTLQLLDAIQIRQLGMICLRLEIASAEIRGHGDDEKLPNGSIVRTNVLHPHMSKEHYPVSLNASDEEMIEHLKNMVIRIENLVSALVLHQLGPFSEVLSALNQVTKIDPGQLMQAISAFAGFMNN